MATGMTTKPSAVAAVVAVLRDHGAANAWLDDSAMDGGWQVETKDAWFEGVAEAVLDALGKVQSDPVVEHAIMMSGGGMQIRSDDPEIEAEYPLARWIPNQQKFGGTVYRRTVTVVEDWQEVPR